MAAYNCPDNVSASDPEAPWNKEEDCEISNQEKIREILRSPNWSESDKAVVKWQFRITGGFFKALWEAICRADDDNLERISRGFPVEVRGYENWTRGDLAGRLRQAGLDI